MLDLGVGACGVSTNLAVELGVSDACADTETSSSPLLKSMEVDAECNEGAASESDDGVETAGAEGGVTDGDG